MGKKSQTEISTSPSPPELVRRRENRQSIFRSGRTIGEKRERLETKNERIAARKKQKRGKVFRIIFTIFCFAILIFILISLYQAFSKREDPVVTENHSLSPTIEIIDEEASSSGQITSRMKTFIARAEKEFRTLNYQPIKAVIPVGSVREVDLYLENYNGFIKMTIDRNPAVSVEDANRMLRYLNEIGVSEFTYIDVRIDGKAYWK